jgi:hypothetical protein
VARFFLVILKNSSDSAISESAVAQDGHLPVGVHRVGGKFIPQAQIQSQRRNELKIILAVKPIMVCRKALYASCPGRTPPDSKARQSTNQQEWQRVLSAQRGILRGVIPHSPQREATLDGMSSRT